MVIKHLIDEDIYFTESYKDKNNNIILLSWENMKKPTDKLPNYFYKKDILNKTGYKPIKTTNNKLVLDLTMEEILESKYVEKKHVYKIDGITVPLELNVDNIFYKINNNGKYQYYYLNDNNKLVKLTAKLVLTEKAKEKEEEFLIENNNYYILIGKGKKKEEIFKAKDKKTFIDLGEQPFINGYNLEFLDFKTDEDENGLADCFHIDYLDNVYVNINNRLKIIKDGKVKNIKLFEIESIFLYKNEQGKEHVLEKYELKGNIEEIKKLTLQDLEKILWSIADLIRDKSSLDDVMDYMRVSIPMLVMKRYLDLREEFIKEEILNEKNLTYIANKNAYPNKYLEMTLKDIYNNEDIFYSVKDNYPYPYYLITWKDIKEFDGSYDSNERKLKLKNFDVSIKTKAKTKQEFFKEVINTFKNEKFNKIFEVTEFINKIENVKKVPNEVFEGIIKLLDEYSFNYKNAPEDIFSQSYMYLIAYFASTGGKKGGEFFTPTSLIRKLLPTLNVKITEKDNITIADPTSGSCSFVIELADILKSQLKILFPNESEKEILKKVNRRIRIITQEKGEISEIMGQVNVMFKNYINHISYNADTINEYQEYIGKHRNTIDFIVANPPYGLNDYGYEYAVNSDENRWQYGVPGKGDGDIAFLLTIIDLLKDGKGKGGILLPLGSMFKDSTKNIRKMLIEEDIIEGLILLPSNMFQTTNIAVVWWIINKNKEDKDKGKIFMVNASNEFIKKGKFNEWQEKKLVKNYLERIEEEGISGYVEYKDIVENNYNLSVQRYIFKDKPEEIIDIVELAEKKKELKKEIVVEETEMDIILDSVVKIELENRKQQEKLLKEKLNKVNKEISNDK